MKTYVMKDVYTHDEKVHHIEIEAIKGEQFKYTTQFTITSDCKNLITLLIGQALMLPSKTEFSIYDLLDMVGEDVYGDIYDEEVYAINILLEMYFEEHFTLCQLQEGEAENIIVKIFQR